MNKNSLFSKNQILSKVVIYNFPWEKRKLGFIPNPLKKKKQYLRNKLVSLGSSCAWIVNIHKMSKIFTTFILILASV